MKKIIALILALVMAMSMSACGCNEQIAAFQQEITSLKTQNEEQNQTIPEETIPEETIPEETIPEETIPEETIPEETIPEETIPEETIPEETIPEAFDNKEAYDALMKELTEQANSGDYDKMYAVAECEYATESHLKTIAYEASYYGLVELACAILDHPNTTATVIEALVSYEFSNVRLEVAKSNKVTEDALLIMADDASYWYNVELARAIADNPNSTESVMEALVYYDFRPDGWWLQ